MIIVGHVLDGKSTESVRWSYSVEPAFPVADCAGFKCLRSCWRESCVQCRGGGHPSRNSSTFQHYYDDKHWVGGYGLSLLEDLATTPHVWFGTSRGTGKEVAVLDLYPAKSIVAKKIYTTTLSGMPVTVMCSSAAISTDGGFKCWNGLFQPTSAWK